MSHLKDRLSWTDISRIPAGNLLSVCAYTLSCFSHVRLFTTLCTIVCQAPLSMGFSRQEYWSGLLFPSPEDLPNPGIEPWSPALQADSVPFELQGRILIGASTSLDAAVHRFVHSGTWLKWLSTHCINALQILGVKSSCYSISVYNILVPFKKLKFCFSILS